jgi:hypothetical protein
MISHFAGHAELEYFLHHGSLVRDHHQEIDALLIYTLVQFLVKVWTGKVEVFHDIIRTLFFYLLKGFMDGS